MRSETHTRGVTGGQVSLLVALEFNPGMTAQELAEREGLSAPGVSGHLARLEGQKLIRRERTSDRRRVGLFVTPDGKQVLATVREQRTSWLAPATVSGTGALRQASIAYVQRGANAHWSRTFAKA